MTNTEVDDTGVNCVLFSDVLDADEDDNVRILRERQLNAGNYQSCCS